MAVKGLQEALIHLITSVAIGRVHGVLVGILRIIGQDVWQFDGFEGEPVEILLRYNQWRVWAHKTNAHEKRFRLWVSGDFLEAFHGPLGVEFVPCGITVIVGLVAHFALFAPTTRAPG